MAQPYKIDKFSVDTKRAASSVPSTKYEPSPASLKNFPSSIVNGVTAEGGLLSLTFKSTNSAEFVEKNELIRGALIRNGDKPDLSVINDKVFDAQKVLEDLKKEVSDLEITTQAKVKENDVDQLQSKLQETLESRGSLKNIGDELQTNYTKTNPSKVITFSNDEYSIPGASDRPQVKAESFEDVQNPDYTPYEKSVEDVYPDITQPAIPNESSQMSIEPTPKDLSYPTDGISYPELDMNAVPDIYVPNADNMEY